MPESAKIAIRQELEQLRRMSGPLDVRKLVLAPVIVKGLGGDDPELALERILTLADDHADDRDVDAALYAMGRGGTGESVLARHTDWADAHFTDQRTARRYADAGIAKLVILIMGPSPWLQPIATQELRQRGDFVTVRFQVQLPPEMAMRGLEVWVNGEEQGVELEREERAIHPRSYRSAIYQLIDTTAEAAAETTLRVRWRGEKPPEYRQVVRARLNANVRARLARWEMWTFLSLAIEPSSVNLKDD